MRLAFQQKLSHDTEMNKRVQHARVNLCMNDVGWDVPCSWAKIAELEKEEAAGWPGCNPMLVKTKLKELKAARAKLSIKAGAVYSHCRLKAPP